VSYIDEYLAFDSRHPFAKEYAEHIWIALKGKSPAPESVNEAYERIGELYKPDVIVVKYKGNEFPKIEKRKYATE